VIVIHRRETVRSRPLDRIADVERRVNSSGRSNSHTSPARRPSRGCSRPTWRSPRIPSVPTA
jgi:hypothetical protein